MFMWATALHEMCHAYEGVRAERRAWKMGISGTFGPKMEAEHEWGRSGCLGLWAIVPAEEDGTAWVLSGGLKGVRKEGMDGGGRGRKAGAMIDGSVLIFLSEKGVSLESVRRA